MDTLDCLECGILRAAYQRATRNELDLRIHLDEADMRSDSVRLQELRALLAAVGVDRARASQSVLDHEHSHLARWGLHRNEEHGSTAQCR